MQNNTRILLIEDDPAIHQMLERCLSHTNLNIDVASCGQDGLARLHQEKFDLVILDLGLPDGDGLDVARRIRSKSELPIIILSGRSEDVDRIVGLELGADDYLGKPFNPRELQARIRAVLKRTKQQLEQPEAPTNGERLTFDNWQLDVQRRCLFDGDGRLVPLTHGQFELLHVFLTHRGRVLTREQLLDLTRGRSFDPYDRSIDVMVSRLRRKVGDSARAQKYIRTYHGGGYVFAAG